MGESNQNVYQRLLAVQTTLRSPTGEVPNGSCEELLEAVKPLLHTAGLAMTLTDYVIDVGGCCCVRAVAKVTPSNGDGGCIETEGYALAISGKASSVARKRALFGLFLLDDDARTASEAQNRPNVGDGDHKAQKEGNPPQKGSKPPQRGRFDKIKQLKEKALALGIAESVIKSYITASFGKELKDFKPEEVKVLEKYLSGIIADAEALKEGEA